MKIPNKKLTQNCKGFISVTALSLFALLIIFSLSVQAMVTDTYKALAATKNYYAASDVAESTMEYMQEHLNGRGPGYNTPGGTITCMYGPGVEGDFELVFEGEIAAGGDNANNRDGDGGDVDDGQRDGNDGDGGDDPVNAGAGDDQEAGVPNNGPDRILDPETIARQEAMCADLLPIIGAPNDEVVVSFEIKGRPEEGENIRTEECRLPGRFGDIIDFNDSCYTEPRLAYGTAGDDHCIEYMDFYKSNDDIVDSDDVDHLNNSCNWNRIYIGSNITDSVTIPLWYQHDRNEDQNPFIVNPNMDFLFRLRPPCAPCNDLDCNITCRDDNRYVVSNTSQQVMQWKITGKCNSDQCSYVPNEASKITATQINSLDNNKVVITGGNSVIDLQSPGREPIISGEGGVLETLENPALSLDFVTQLVDEEDRNINYIEYQLLTQRPVSFSNSFISIYSQYNNIKFSSNLTSSVDNLSTQFAIQN